MKCFHNLAECSQKDADSSNDCSLKHKRNIILEQIGQSLDSSGLKKCIQSALVFPPGSGSGNTVKVYIYPGEADPAVFSLFILIVAGEAWLNIDDSYVEHEHFTFLAFIWRWMSSSQIVS